MMDPGRKGKEKERGKGGGGEAERTRSSGKGAPKRRLCSKRRLFLQCAKLPRKGWRAVPKSAFSPLVTVRTIQRSD